MSASSSAHGREEVARPRHAGVWVRVAAAIVDFIAMGVPVALVVVVVFSVDLEERQGLFSTPNLVIMALLTVITILLWVNWDGRTPGKKVLRIRIVSYPDCQPFSYGTASLRTVLSLSGALTFGLGYLIQAFMIAAREDKRGYHDLLARTCVVHDR